MAPNFLFSKLYINTYHFNIKENVLILDLTKVFWNDYKNGKFLINF